MANSAFSKLTLVSHFLLQGKTVRAVVIKSRSTSAKTTTSNTPKKSAKSSRSTSVPVDRKENVIEFVPQPCCSHTSSVGSSISIGVQRMKPTLRPSKTSNIRNRTKNLKYTTSSEKPNTKSRNPPAPIGKQKIKVDLASKLQVVKDLKQPKRQKDDSERVQLREICFIKDNDGKKVIAKYNKSDNSQDSCEDNLIVSWEAGSSNAQVFSQKSPIIQNFFTGKVLSEAGPSKKGAFRVHNFSKTTSFSKTKRNKRSLRRLAGNTENTGKIDKVKKRKKMKTKVVA